MKRKERLKYVKRRIYNQKLSVVSLYILIINTRCRIVALSAVVKFMIVNVLNDEELPTIVFARKHSLVHKTGEANATILVLFPAK